MTASSPLFTAQLFVCGCSCISVPHMPVVLWLQAELRRTVYDEFVQLRIRGVSGGRGQLLG